MGGSIVALPIGEQRAPAGFSLGGVTSLLDTLDESLLVAERSGRILLANSRARKCVAGLGELSQLNLFTDLLKVDAKEIFGEIESGEIKLDVAREGKNSRVTVRWMPEPDWFVVQIEKKPEALAPPDPATQVTVQELLQEREITY